MGDLQSAHELIPRGLEIVRGDPFIWPVSAVAGDYEFIMALTRPGTLDVKAMATEIVRFD